MIASLLGVKLGATVAGIAVGLSGTAVAAYTGTLPSGVQNLAHVTIGAPAAASATRPAATTPAARPAVTPKPTKTPKPRTTDKAVGPDATGPAAYGLCNAWSRHQANGARPTGSVAFRNLATAAGGAGKIAAYCATIPHPGNSDHPRGKSKDKNPAKPTTHPTKTAKPSTT